MMSLAVWHFGTEKGISNSQDVVMLWALLFHHCLPLAHSMRLVRSLNDQADTSLFPLQLCCCASSQQEASLFMKFILRPDLNHRSQISVNFSASRPQMLQVTKEQTSALNSKTWKTWLLKLTKRCRLGALDNPFLQSPFLARSCSNLALATGIAAICFLLAFMCCLNKDKTSKHVSD